MKEFFSKYKYPLTLWTLCVAFLAYQFIVRLSAGILREDIMIKFGVSTIEFGSLAGFYYLGYAGFQIPIGFMLDKFNTRYVTFSWIIITSIGILTFVYADNWNIVLLGRFLIGAGSAAGFLSATKITKEYFPEKYHGNLLAITFSIGLLGAIFGGTPMQTIFDLKGYNFTFLLLAIIPILIGICILLVSKNNLKELSSISENEISINKVFRLLIHPHILIIGICGGLMVGPLEGFADVWSITFFEQAYGYTKNQSVLIGTSNVFIGMSIGGPILIWFKKYIKSDHWLIFITGLIVCIIFAILFLFKNLNASYSFILTFLIGIMSCYQVIAFNLVTEISSYAYVGITIAITNCLNMSFGFLFHKIIGIVIDFYWDGAISDKNVPIYTRECLIYGLSIIPIGCILGMIGFLYLYYSKRFKKLDI